MKKDWKDCDIYIRKEENEKGNDKSIQMSSIEKVDEEHLLS